VKDHKIKSKPFDKLVDSLDADKEEEKRYELIGKFAIAQALMGIEKTLDWKNKIIGRKPLHESSIEDLTKLIKKLRGVYRWQRENQQEKN